MFYKNTDAQWSLNRNSSHLPNRQTDCLLLPLHLHSLLLSLSVWCDRHVPVCSPHTQSSLHYSTWLYLVSHSVIYLFVFKTRTPDTPDQPPTHYIGEDNFELPIFLPLPPKFRITGICHQVILGLSLVCFLSSHYVTLAGLEFRDPPDSTD